MDRTVIRNAGLSLALCAGLGLGGLALAAQPALADQAKTDDTAATASTTDAKASDSKDAAKTTDTKDTKSDNKTTKTDTKDAKTSDSKDAKTTDSKDAKAPTLKDGTYTASSKGIGGDVPVTVTIKDGKISKVEVGDNSETQGIGSKAIEQLPEKIVKANGTDGVDAVSGASVTSKAIFTAVNDCLDQAKATDSSATTTDKKDSKTDTKATDSKDAASSTDKDADTKDAASSTDKK